MADISVFHGKSTSGTGAGTGYVSVFGDETGLEAETQTYWLEPGVFRNFRVRLTAAVTAATTIVYTLRINGVSSLMAITFNPGDTSLTYVAGDIAVSAGDLVGLQTINSGSGGGLPTWSMEFEPTSGSKSVYANIFHNGSGTTPLYFGSLCGFYTGHGGIQQQVVGVIPCPGDITAAGVCLDTAPGGSHIFVLWLSTDDGATWVKQDGSGGSVDTRVTLSALRTATATFTLPVVAGDLIYTTYERVSGGAVNVYGAYSIAFDPTTAGQFIVPGFSRNQLSTGAGAFYMGGRGATTGVSGTEGGISLVAGPTSIALSKLRVWLSTNPGATKSYQFDYTRDESTSPAAGSPTVTISDAAVTGTDSSNQYGLTDDHPFTLREVATGTPTAAYMSWAAIGTPGTVTTSTGFARATLMFFG